MLVTEEINNAIAAKGMAIYNEKLKATLEPEHNNEYVVIHVDSGDYAVAPRSLVAIREMLKRHGADGRLCELHIGPEPEYELAARLIRPDQSKGQAPA